MRVIASNVSKGAGGSALPETSLEVHSGQATLAAMETEQRPTVLSLIVSGRMRPTTGSVTIDGSASRRELRKRLAIVDALDVSEPHADVRFGEVVAEELMFAGRMPAPWAVRSWLDDHGMREHEARERIVQLQRREELEDADGEQDPAPLQAGRNDPCPCGSGKKFKKCCG